MCSTLMKVMQEGKLPVGWRECSFLFIVPRHKTNMFFCDKTEKGLLLSGKVMRRKNIICEIFLSWFQFQPVRRLLKLSCSSHNHPFDIDDFTCNELKS